MHVAELLRVKGTDVATVSPQDSIGQAVDLLRLLNIGALVVSNDGQSIDGIISERDIVRALGVDPAAMLLEPVSTVMTADVHTCAPADPVDGLMPLMTDLRIRHLPVVANDALAGIISIGDVVKARVAELETEAQVLTEYIRQGR